MYANASKMTNTNDLSITNTKKSPSTFKQTDRQPRRQTDTPEEKNKVNGNGDYNQVRLTSVLQAC